MFLCARGGIIRYTSPLTRSPYLERKAHVTEGACNLLTICRTDGSVSYGQKVPFFLIFQ